MKLNLHYIYLSSRFVSVMLPNVSSRASSTAGLPSPFQAHRTVLARCVTTARISAFQLHRRATLNS